VSLVLDVVVVVVPLGGIDVLEGGIDVPFGGADWVGGSFGVPVVVPEESTGMVVAVDLGPVPCSWPWS